MTKQRLTIEIAEDQTPGISGIRTIIQNGKVIRSEGYDNHKKYSSTIETDLERFIDLYQKFGIKCKVTETENGDNAIHFRTYNELIEDESIELECAKYATMDKRIIGYSGFYVEIRFDKDGEFIGQSIGE